MVPECKDMNYEERLRFLGLPTLHYRRERADMIQVLIQVFKIMNDYESVNIDNLNRCVNSHRGHSLKLSKSFTRTRFGQNRFSNRIVNGWNSLSGETWARRCV